MFIFGCILDDLYAVTQLNLAYIVNKERRTVIELSTSIDDLFEKNIQFKISSLRDQKGIHRFLRSKIKISTGEEKYIVQDVTKPIICLPSISWKNRLIERTLFTLLLLTNVRRK